MRWIAKPRPVGCQFRATRPEVRSRDLDDVARPAAEHRPARDKCYGRALLHASSRRLDRHRQLARQSDLATDRADENRSCETAADAHHGAGPCCRCGFSQMALQESALVGWQILVRLGRQAPELEPANQTELRLAWGALIRTISPPRGRSWVGTPEQRQLTSVQRPFGHLSGLYRSLNSPGCPVSG